jgi:hypothetical protein
LEHVAVSEQRDVSKWFVAPEFVAGIGYGLLIMIYDVMMIFLHFFYTIYDVHVK